MKKKWRNEPERKKKLKTSPPSMILLRWCSGRSNIDVVRVFQRWYHRWKSQATGCHRLIQLSRRFSNTPTRTWKFWNDAHNCARIPVARCPGYTTCGCASSFLGSSSERPREGSWSLTIVGATNVSSAFLLQRFHSLSESLTYYYYKITIFRIL